MPRKPPPKEHQFKKGKSGNPEGARAHNPIRKALKNLTVQSYREVIEAVCTGNLAELKRMVEDPTTSALQVGVAKAFVKALNDGDYATIERIAERIVGKIPDELNVVSKNLNANVNTKPIDRKEVVEIVKKLEGDV